MKIIYWVERSVLSIIIIFTSCNSLFSQISDKIINVQNGQPIEKNPVTVTAELSPNFVFNKIEFVYRAFGESEFKGFEMSLTGNKASFTIPADKMIPPYIEYYLRLYIKDLAESETYPIENPLDHPVKLVISPAVKPNHDVAWLSPEIDQTSTPEDFLIAFSIPETDTSTNISATKIYMDDQDVTGYAVRSEDLFVIQPENITPRPSEGVHRLLIEIFGRDGIRLDRIERELRIKKIDEYKFDVTELKYSGSVQLETRNENIGGTHNSYNDGSMNASVTYSQFKALGNLYITSEEKTNRQPQNRYFIGAESPWLKIGYGDSYPTLPNLIMNGKRLRGLSSNLSLGFFNLDFVYGEITRKVDNKYTIIDSLPAGVDTSTYFRPDSTTYAVMNQRGEFKRNLLVVRPSFGSGENYQLGFSFLKSKDDKNSITYGLMPKENLVIGTDLLLAFDRRNIELTAQAAFSVSNNDISQGNISDERLRSLGDTEDIDTSLIKKMRDIFSKFITVNENIVPLNLKHLPTLAYEAALSLNYFDNAFKFSYLRRGTSFESFGQSYLRNDVAGFNITDRFKMLSNRIFLSLGFEKLSDNLSDLKPATTKFSTFSSTASYYPEQDLPNVSLGYVYASAINNLQHDNTDATDDYTNRFFIQTGYNFVFLEKQSAILSINTSDREDQTSKNLDTKNFSLLMGLNTFYSFPLQTAFSISFNNSSSRYMKWNYTSLALTGYYKMLEHKLNLNAGIRSTFGDIKRSVFDLGAQYTIIKDLNILGQVSLFTYKSEKNESVWSLTLRYDI